MGRTGNFARDDDALPATTIHDAPCADRFCGTGHARFVFRAPCSRRVIPASCGSIQVTARTQFAAVRPVVLCGSSMSLSASSALFDVRPQTSHDIAAVDDLLDLAFGPGRFAKASYRLREGVAEVPGLSFVAEYRDDERRDLAGSIRYWPVEIGPNESGAVRSALLLGPLAVSPDLQGKGAGVELMEVSLEAAAQAGHGLVLLVGDLAYYERVGFSQVPSGQIEMPQPFDPQRLLWRSLVDGAEVGVAGNMVRPAGG